MFALHCVHVALKIEKLKLIPHTLDKITKILFGGKLQFYFDTVTEY